jgi:hypothetical protein
MEFFVIRVLNIDQVIIIDPWMPLIRTPQKLHRSLVHYSSLPIHLWMEGCGYLQFCVKILQQCILKGTKEFGILVRNEAPSYIEVHFETLKK